LAYFTNVQHKVPFQMLKLETLSGMATRVGTCNQM